MDSVNAAKVHSVTIKVSGYKKSKKKLKKLKRKFKQLNRTLEKTVELKEKLF